MTRTEWNWLLGKPTDETMIVIDDGVLAMLDEYVKKQRMEAFQQGAETFRRRMTAFALGVTSWKRPTDETQLIIEELSRMQVEYEDTE